MRAGDSGSRSATIGNTAATASVTQMATLRQP